MAKSRERKQQGDEGQVPVKQIRHLVQLMKDYELEEIYWQDGTRRIRLRKQGAGTSAPPPVGWSYPMSPVAPLPPASPTPPAPPTTPSSTDSPETEKASEAEDTAKYVEIKSPMVGTFYAAPAPDKPPFVEVGTHVEPDTIVCLIEAMKVFNEIPAEVSGKIVKVLVENGQPVEYGQPLFLVDPAG